MPNASMALPIIEHVHPNTSFGTTSNRPTLKPVKKNSSSNTKSETVIGGVENFRKCLPA